MSSEAAASREAVEQKIVALVREHLLLGSDRPIPLDRPLGELSVGLDSLAFVELVTAVEAAFRIEIADEIWASRGPLSVRQLAELAIVAPKVAETVRRSERGQPPRHHRMERLELLLSEGTWVRRLAWAGARAAAPLKRFLFQRVQLLVLERELEDLSFSVDPPIGIVLRPFAATDERSLDGLWPSFSEQAQRRKLARWLRAGSTVLIAAEGSRVVGLDVLFTKSGEGIELPAGGTLCCGYYLTEAPFARGRGIGLALVAYSLAVARDLGFRTQVTAVDVRNEAMLSATTQLLGFRVSGRAARTSVLGLAYWSWEINGRRGRGRRLRLETTVRAMPRRIKASVGNV